MPTTSFLLSLLAFVLGGTGRSRDDAVLSILERAALHPERGAAELVAELSRLGTPAIPELFTVLVHGSTGQRDLSEAETQILMDALCSLPLRELREHFKRSLESGLDTDERRAFLLVLARVGSSDDLPLARAVVQAGDESPSLARALESATENILRRQPLGMEVVRRWTLQASPALREALVRGIAASGCTTSLSALVALLGFNASLDRVLVSEIRGVVQRAQKPIADDALAALNELLESDDPALLREAAIALGDAEDFGATGKLIELLEHPERGVRSGAASALERLTGLAFRERSARWSAWHQTEERWFREQRARLHSQLRAAELEAVASALSEISQHRFRRHQLAAEVATVLDHPNPLARKLACLTLSRLQSSLAIPRLVRATGDPDADVQAAARAALDSLGFGPGSA